MKTYTGYRKPMLALPLGDTLPSGDCVAEQKWDGHRIIVDINDKHEGRVRAWSARLGNGRSLRPAIVEQLQKLPECVLDTEVIVPGGGSSAVKEIANEGKTEMIIFDLLTLEGTDLTPHALSVRRGLLEQLPRLDAPVQYSQQVRVKSMEEVTALAKQMWKQGAEGLIVKDLRAPYECGKRRIHFAKVKELHSKVLTVRGFVATEGEIMDRGRFASVVLEDEKGITTVVKTLDDAELERMEKEFGKSVEGTELHRLSSGKKVMMIISHPRVGTELRIDYHQMTSDGNYRHPRWDRWECE